MRVRWDGPRVVSRAVGELEWSIRTDFVQEVDTDLALELLTTPGERFLVAEDEPLLGLPGMDEGRLITLVAHGVTSMAGLAALSAAEVKALALAMWGSSREIGEWVRLAGQQEAMGQEARGERREEARRRRIEKLREAGIASVKALAGLEEADLVTVLAPIWGECQVEGWQGLAQDWTVTEAVRIEAEAAEAAAEGERARSGDRPEQVGEERARSGDRPEQAGEGIGG